MASTTSERPAAGWPGSDFPGSGGYRGRPVADWERLLRRGTEALVPYSPGKSAADLRRKSGPEPIKLSSNENVLGPSPLALVAASQALREAHLYPDKAAWRLRAALAERLNLEPQSVLVGNGGDNLITILAQTLLNPGEQALIPAPSFASYETAVRLMGGEVVRVPLRSHRIDLEAMGEQVTGRTKLVFLCTPNNPTGTTVGRRETERFLERLWEKTGTGAVVVFDEAYIEFAEDPDRPDSLQWVRQGLPVVAIRTFSKLYGLAGLRVGYALGPAPLVAFMDRVREPFAANRVAIAAAAAALSDEEHVERTLAAVREAKAFLYRELERRGVEYVPTQANFLLVNGGVSADALCETMMDEGVIVRSGTFWNLDTWIRVSLGPVSWMERFLEAFDRARARLQQD